MGLVTFCLSLVLDLVTSILRLVLGLVMFCLSLVLDLTSFCICLVLVLGWGLLELVTFCLNLQVLSLCTVFSLSLHWRVSGGVLVSGPFKAVSPPL